MTINDIIDKIAKWDIYRESNDVKHFVGDLKSKVRATVLNGVLNEATVRYDTEVSASPPLDVPRELGGNIDAEIRDINLRKRENERSHVEMNRSGLNEEQIAAATLWAADDRLWTTQETVEFNLLTFARTILAALRSGQEKETQPGESDVMAQAVSHWFCQGGEQRFGAIGNPTNADELIAAILRQVAAPLPICEGLETGERVALERFLVRVGLERHSAENVPNLTLGYAEMLLLAQLAEDRLKAAASRSPLGGWEPIDASPKTGAKILGYHASSGDIHITRWFEPWKEWVIMHTNGCWHPTHWMPLPSAPQEEK